jgi:hypothetical protein
MTLYIAVARGVDHERTVWHKQPLVQFNYGEFRQAGCSIGELVKELADADAALAKQAARDIGEKGWTVLESTKIVEADLNQIFEPIEEDLGASMIADWTCSGAALSRS